MNYFLLGLFVGDISDRSHQPHQPGQRPSPTRVTEYRRPPLYLTSSTRSASSATQICPCAAAHEHHARPGGGRVRRGMPRAQPCAPPRAGLMRAARQGLGGMLPMNLTPEFDHVGSLQFHCDAYYLNGLITDTRRILTFYS